MRASIIVRELPAFRFDAFAAGLESCGYTVERRPHRHIPKADDVLLLWNRSHLTDRHAQVFQNAGARVIVAENGYLGREWRGRVWYALALDHHNGAGRWPAGETSVSHGDSVQKVVGIDALSAKTSEFQRWDSWNVRLEPWRDFGDEESEIVILAQRGIGEEGVRQPQLWPRDAQKALQARSRRPVRIRRHPGERRRGVALPDDLRNAWAVVTWGSGAALKALMMGIPAFHAFPQWIGAPAALPWSADLEQPFRGDRLPMFRRLAHAQYEIAEIASGMAFRALLCRAWKGQV